MAIFPSTKAPGEAPAGTAMGFAQLSPSYGCRRFVGCAEATKRIMPGLGADRVPSIRPGARLDAAGGSPGVACRDAMGFAQLNPSYGCYRFVGCAEATKRITPGLGVDGVLSIRPGARPDAAGGSSGIACRDAMGFAQLSPSYGCYRFVGCAEATKRITQGLRMDGGSPSANGSRAEARATCHGAMKKGGRPRPSRQSKGATRGGAYQLSTTPRARVSVSSFWVLPAWPSISNWLYSATSLRLSLTSWNRATPRVW